MRLLNDEALCEYINRPEPLVKGLEPLGDWFAKDSPVQPSSIDLHIGSIFLPGTKHGEDGSEDKPLASHTLGPGETALVTTLEIVHLPGNVAAIGFPPSRVSAQGLLMTNPGHIDPGYRGPMHFTVINMARQDFSLRKGGMIVTVLFFEMSAAARSDYTVRNGVVSGAPRQEDINRLSGDFLDVTERAKKVANDQIQSFDMKRLVVTGLISLALLAATYFVPLWTGISELKEKVAKLEQAQGTIQTTLDLERRIRALEVLISAQRTTISPEAAPSGQRIPQPAQTQQKKDKN